MKYGGIFDKNFAANLRENRTVKKLKVAAISLVSLVFGA